MCLCLRLYVLLSLVSLKTLSKTSCNFVNFWSFLAKEVDLSGRVNSVNKMYIYYIHQICLRITSYIIFTCVRYMHLSQDLECYFQNVSNSGFWYTQCQHNQRLNTLIYLKFISICCDTNLGFAFRLKIHIQYSDSWE